MARSKFRPKKRRGRVRQGLRRTAAAFSGTCCGADHTEPEPAPRPRLCKADHVPVRTVGVYTRDARGRTTVFRADA